MRVLITGASGFVGSTLADFLIEAGHEVRLLMRRSSSRANLGCDGYSICEGDICLPGTLAAAVQDVEVIFHVAGAISARTSAGFFQANAQGTENLARAAAQHARKLKRFVYVSSLAAAGPATRDKPRLEIDEPRPISIYGESKLGGEVALRRLAGELPSVIVRPPVVYGPRDRGMLAFFKIVRYGFLPIITGRGPDPGGYSFIHVDDLVQALAQVGFANREFAPAEIFHAAGDGEHTWSETMRMMADAFAKKGVAVPLPLPLLKAAGYLLGNFSRVSGASVALTPDKVKEIAAPYWTCTNSKLKEAVGFTPYWKVADGFRQTAAWYRDRAWL